MPGLWRDQDIALPCAAIPSDENDTEKGQYRTCRAHLVFFPMAVSQAAQAQLAQHAQQPPQAEVAAAADPAQPGKPAEAAKTVAESVRGQPHLCIVMDITSNKPKKVGKYLLGKILGKGAFGTVRLGQNTATGAPPHLPARSPGPASHEWSHECRL